MSSSSTDSERRETAAAAAGGAGDGPLVEVTMPQMGVSVAEGTLAVWHKQPGDWVQEDETICEISTDKIDSEVPAPASGRVGELLVEPGATVEVGAVLARIATDARPGEAHASESVAQGAPAQQDEASAGAPAPRAEAQTPPQAAKTRSGKRRYSPVVQRIAAEHGIDLEQVQGSGRGGRVRKQDVLAAVEANGSSAPAEPAAERPEPPLHIESPYRPEPQPPAGAAAGGSGADAPAGAPAPMLADGGGLSRMRRQIGEHMKRSLQTAATCTTWAEADMGAVEESRRRLGLTALPIVARCAIDALREHPALNATLDGDDHRQHADINLGIAVSLGEDGLIVPVIQRAQELSAEGLGARIRDLARRARSRELSPDEVHGGTFTITNPGQFGSIMATPVINQPQVAILDLEAIVRRVVAVGEREDAIAVRPMTILGLSWDHRALDGALAAQFLATLRRRLEGWRE